MLTGFHHEYHRHIHPAKHTGRLARLAKRVDDFAFPMGFLAAAVNVPQLIDVYTKKDISGVSLWSWAGFLFAAVFWLFYGILHRAKTLIVINSMLIVVQGLVVVKLLFR